MRTETAQFNDMPLSPDIPRRGGKLADSRRSGPPGPFLCTYMGRARNGKPPFRFLWNRSQATAHNVYLMLYPKGPLRAALRNRPELEESVFKELL